ncbi:MAG: cold-shock protein [Nocardioidaceae bacterium]
MAPNDVGSQPRGYCGDRGARRSLESVQGTVRSFDGETRAGSIVLDDGRTLDFTPTVFVASGLRLLRPGQRVRFEIGPDGEIERLTIITLQG